MCENLLGVHLLKCYSKGVVSLIVKQRLMVIMLKNSSLCDFFKFLFVHRVSLMVQLLDVWVVDYPGLQTRFEIGYLFLSVRFKFRFLVKVRIKEEEGLESVTNLYKSAGWLEREIMDMYGLYFYNNHDLRRILTDYGFNGFPLRKDFPLTGFVEVRYDDGEKRVVLEPLELSQDFRHFMFLSPWEMKVLR